MFFFVVYATMLRVIRLLALNGDEIKTMEGRFMANLRHFPGIWLDELRQTSSGIAGNGADTYIRELTDIK